MTVVREMGIKCDNSTKNMHAMHQEMRIKGDDCTKKCMHAISALHASVVK